MHLILLQIENWGINFAPWPNAFVLQRKGTQCLTLITADAGSWPFEIFFANNGKLDKNSCVHGEWSILGRSSTFQLLKNACYTLQAEHVFLCGSDQHLSNGCRVLWLVWAACVIFSVFCIFWSNDEEAWRTKRELVLNSVLAFAETSLVWKLTELNVVLCYFADRLFCRTDASWVLRSYARTGDLVSSFLVPEMRSEFTSYLDPTVLFSNRKAIDSCFSIRQQITEAPNHCGQKWNHFQM